MYKYSELESIAAKGGYDPSTRDITRITAANVHQLYAGLVGCGLEEAKPAMVVVSKLRHWLVHGNNRPPLVRGAGFARSDRELWMAYTMYKSPALLRGRPRTFANLRRYLAIAVSPDYDGSLQVRTNPPINLNTGDDVVLQSSLGVITLNMQTTLRVERWLSGSVLRRDRRCVLCLPATWHNS